MSHSFSLDTLMTELYTAMRRYYFKSASAATQKSYMAGNKQYVQFCQQSSLPCVPYLREDTATVCHLLGNWWFILCHHQSVLGSSLALIHDGRTPQYLRHSIHLQDPTFVKRHSQGICKASTSQKAPSKIMKRIKQFLDKQPIKVAMCSMLCCIR